MEDQEYSDAWMAGEAAAATPAQDGATQAAQAEREASDREFSDAFKEAAEGGEPAAKEKPAAEPAPQLGLKPPADDKPKAPGFKEAFAQARKAGLKVFEWQGKKYTTELAKPAVKKAEPKDEPRAEAAAAPAVKPPSERERLAESVRGKSGTREVATAHSFMGGALK